MIKRILVCSSMTQLINSLAAINKLKEGKKITTTIIIINPFLDDKDINKIISFAKNNNIERVLNFSLIFKFYIKNIKKKNNSKFNILITKLYYKFYKIKLLNKALINIKNQLIKNDLSTVDTLFTRGRVKIYESILINSFKKINKIYCVEDGVGDYINPKSIWSLFLIYEIKFLIIKKINQIIDLIFTYLLTFNFEKALIFSSNKETRFNKVFRNIFVKNYEYKYLTNNDFIYTKKEFLEIVKSFTNKSKFNYKIIIYDSLLNDQLKIEFDKVPILYNSIITKIINTKKIDKKDIFFRHHPRLKYKYWKILKKNLVCDMSDFNDNLSEIPGEFLLNNKSLKEVYSVGSTALFYSKFVFNKDSYLIIFDNKKFHPSAFIKYKYVFLKYKFKVFDASKLIKL